ncbi:MAG: DUF3800 domain-containing protein, partial [Aliifodinibius sp.]|nr:DUF3800 domain-containing protein [candidate division Zixibacteria bacterium]NIS49332.1 DUF3800 domain-containing protein [candidate division Zixibacteria bacterium]NIT55955.1 DUF3800 domain-containing protein [Fodinibius sp.]NIU17398.1 DUF3800 domain-containing protein [candidate division Zixibacteria bacterium]NIY24539.1 DUF3800 domain-containing protein [Fodinibius sp.]
MDQPITKLWLDESGDRGFKFNKGSSRFFVIAAVFFVEEGLNETEQAITDLKTRLNLPPDYEFKFSRSSYTFREEFLKMVLQLPVEYKAIVIDKQNLTAPALIHQPQQLYAEAVKRLLYDNNPPIVKATLMLDEATAKIHHKEFNSIIRRYLSKKVVRKIKQLRSQSSIMIQVAD